MGELGKEAPPQQKRQKESQQMDEECFKKNWIIVEEPTSCYLMLSIVTGTEQKRGNTTMGWRRQQKEDIHRCGKTGTHQTALPSKNNTCHTSVQKETSVHTDSNRNKKQKEYSKCDESNHKVHEMVFLNASQWLLTLCYLSLNKATKKIRRSLTKMPMFVFIDNQWLMIVHFILGWRRKQ